MAPRTRLGMLLLRFFLAFIIFSRVQLGRKGREGFEEKGTKAIYPFSCFRSGGFWFLCERVFIWGEM